MKSYEISTHTLTWSVTVTLKKKTKTEIISTHTLTWSVTGSFCSFLSAPCHFNSHAHVERDGIITMLFLDERNFNSHAHVERDQIAKCLGLLVI